MNEISFLTKEKYMSLVKKYEGGHWTPQTIDRRWEYHSRVIELAKSLNIARPNQVLEMGTMGVSCIEGSDTIDYLERWDFPGKKPTIVHDSRITPWPIKDKQYELFIALRVFQHLTPFQREATKEAMRIARKVIIAVPENYNNRRLPDARGINYADFVDFLDGIHPNLYFYTHDEYVYYWDVESPSKLNIEAVMHRMYLDNSQTSLYSRQGATHKIKQILKGQVSSILSKISGSRPKTLVTVGSKRLSTNRHIEFLGPAGVGKSTICNEARKQLSGDWLYKESLSDVLPQDTDIKIDESLYVRLLDAKIKNLENYKLGNFQKIKLVRLFSDLLLKDFVMTSRASSNKFLLEEGLCHNFYEELIGLTDSDLKPLLADRALVYVQSRDSQRVVDQIRKRERETGRIVNYHFGLDDKDLKDLVDLSFSMFRIFVERAEALGVPICRIFIEDGIQMNVKQVLDFEKRLLVLT